MMFRVLCCLLPLALVGLFAIGLGGYALITGKGGAWVKDDVARTRSAGGPVMTRVVGGIGLVVGIMIVLIALAMGFALFVGQAAGAY